MSSQENFDNETTTDYDDDDDVNGHENNIRSDSSPTYRL